MLPAADLRSAGPLALQIHPPLTHSAWLWLVALGLLLAGVGLGWLMRRCARAWEAEKAAGEATVESLRADCLARIEQLRADHEAGLVDDRQVHQELSAALRQFVGTAGDGDEDYQVLSEIRRSAAEQPRLVPLADFVEAGYLASYSASGESSVEDALARAREVATGWK